LDILAQHDNQDNPARDRRSTTATKLKKLDVDALVDDVKQLLVTSQSWWPATGVTTAVS